MTSTARSWQPVVSRLRGLFSVGGKQPPGISCQGVHTRHLRELLNERPELRDRTMKQICDELVKPATMQSKNSYAEFLLLQPTKTKHVTKVADMFVSYPWSTKFGLLVSSLAEFDGFVYVDVFIVNQHIHQVINTDVLQKTFGNAVEAIGLMGIICSPWRQPENVGRAWCVFELLTASKRGVKTKVLMAAEEKEDLIRAMTSGELGLAGYTTLFGGVNVSNCKAKVKEDRRVILQLLKRAGATKVNNLVLEELKTWLVEVGKGAKVKERSAEACQLFASMQALHQAQVRNIYPFPSS
jgi:hypothetical protein